jgi:hypothetical protein
VIGSDVSFAATMTNIIGSLITTWPRKYANNLNIKVSRMYDNTNTMNTGIIEPYNRLDVFNAVAT